jgi:hypothetical protein
LIGLLGSIILVSPTLQSKVQAQTLRTDATKLFSHDNLVAWCIVPFDAK